MYVASSDVPLEWFLFFSLASIDINALLSGIANLGGVDEVLTSMATLWQNVGVHMEAVMKKMVAEAHNVKRSDDPLYAKILSQKLCQFAVVNQSLYLYHICRCWLYMYHETCLKMSKFAKYIFFPDIFRKQLLSLFLSQFNDLYSIRLNSLFH